MSTRRRLMMPAPLPALLLVLAGLSPLPAVAAAVATAAPSAAPAAPPASSAVAGRQFQWVQGQGRTARVLGVVRLDAQDRLSVVSVRAADAQRLRQRVDEINSQGFQQLDAAPPASAPALADVSAPVPRGDARFLPALQQQLQRYDDVQLKPLAARRQR